MALMPPITADTPPVLIQLKKRKKRQWLKISIVIALVFTGVAIGFYFLDKSKGWSWLSTKNVYKGLGYGGICFALSLLSIGIAYHVKVRRLTDDEIRFLRQELRKDINTRYPVDRATEKMLASIITEEQAENQHAMSVSATLKENVYNIFTLRWEELEDQRRNIALKIQKPPTLDATTNEMMDLLFKTRFPDSRPAESLAAFEIYYEDQRRAATVDHTGYRFELTDTATIQKYQDYRAHLAKLAKNSE